ncbi:HD domain-containing protein [Candidatus Poribacteria bacterium]|nr:HD domain-containing protein [Candidatus Poribacteria bacterium]
MEGKVVKQWRSFWLLINQLKMALRLICQCKSAGSSEFCMDSKQENKIKEFVRISLKNTDIAHGFDHIEYVVAMAKKIAIEEKADLRIVIPAAYLHDAVSRAEVESFDEHTDESALVAADFLREIGFSHDEIGRIVEVIKTSSYESYLKGEKPISIEAKVVRDADWLDSMGARGIARVFAFAGHYGCPEMGKVSWHPESPVKLEMSTKGPDPSPLYHFFSKLLWLKDEMQTSAGKIEAQKRHQPMVDFLNTYKSETETDQ